VCAAACGLLQGRKERRRYSVNRSFFGDYVNLDAQPKLRKLLNDKRERVEFADYVTKYDRRGKARLFHPYNDLSIYRHCPHSMRSRVCVTVGCPYVRPSVRAICC